MGSLTSQSDAATIGRPADGRGAFVHQVQLGQDGDSRRLDPLVVQVVRVLQRLREPVQAGSGAHALLAVEPQRAPPALGGGVDLVRAVGEAAHLLAAAERVRVRVQRVGDAVWRRYGEHLAALRDEPYREEVFAYIEREDTPRSLPYQLGLMRRVGFDRVDVLHKRLCFAAFGGIRSGGG